VIETDCVAFDYPVAAGFRINGSKVAAVQIFLSLDS
jgi:hypothetical protein